ncbi:hypothetical protein [Zavarzinella formosa]|uniref:hypothetical protein n=1 Tax=Zavarzinella formosa TaxID=360055 RepID=UPI0002F0DAB7|nr:hypothetical protein [Zavarzinella formosa]
MPTVKVLLVTPSRVVCHEAPVDLNGFVLPAFVNGLLGKTGWIITADQSLAPNITVWCVNPKLSADGKSASSVQLKRNFKAEQAVKILTEKEIAVIGDMLIVGTIPDGKKAGQAAEMPAEKLTQILRL